MVNALAELNDRLFDIKSQCNDTASIRETLAPSRAPTSNQAMSATDTLLQQLVQQVAALSARSVQVPVAAPEATVRPPPGSPRGGNGSTATSSHNTTSENCPRPFLDLFRGNAQNTQD